MGATTGEHDLRREVGMKSMGEDLEGMERMSWSASEIETGGKARSGMEA
jgi:hypothetical protein